MDELIINAKQNFPYVWIGPFVPGQAGKLGTLRKILHKIRLGNDAVDGGSNADGGEAY